ncbi:MAG: hypothetical protein OXH19_14345 [Chloroflexi bacterium]|nr:hypothetical protein [Chloroflexota bacterium]
MGWSEGGEIWTELDKSGQIRTPKDAVAGPTTGWDPGELTHLLLFLHREPHVLGLGLGYNQYADAEE